MTNAVAALAATLCIGMATGASAAIEPSADAPNPDALKPIEELEQLAEIRVRGKSLARTISDAEDDFFKHYNKANRNPDFEVVCGHMRVNGSLIMQRKCVPGYIADYVSDYSATRASYYRSSSFGCVSTASAMSDFSQGSQMYGGFGCSQGISASMAMPISISSAPAAMAARPPLDLLAMSKRGDYLKNVLQVINSDPELVAKVWHLKSLYGEMKQVQGRYLKVSQAELMTTHPRRLRPR